MRRGLLLLLLLLRWMCIRSPDHSLCLECSDGELDELSEQRVGRAHELGSACALIAQAGVQRQ